MRPTPENWDLAWTSKENRFWRFCFKNFLLLKCHFYNAMILNFLAALFVTLRVSTYLAEALRESVWAEGLTWALFNGWQVGPAGFSGQFLPPTLDENLAALYGGGGVRAWIEISGCRQICLQKGQVIHSCLSCWHCCCPSCCISCLGCYLYRQWPNHKAKSGPVIVDYST